SYLPKSASFKELDSIMFAPYPHGDTHYANAEADTQMSHLMRVIRSIRNIRQTFEVPAKTEAEVLIAVTDDGERKLLENSSDYIKRLATANPVTVGGGNEKPSGKAAFELISATTVFVPLEKLIDVEKTREKLVQRFDAKKKERDRAKDLLENDSFRAKAPI